MVLSKACVMLNLFQHLKLRNPKQVQDDMQFKIVTVEI